jgi:hypothetical protein
VFGAVVLGLAAASPTLALAEPPAGIAFDGVVTVHHVDPDHGPLAGSLVSVKAFTDPTRADIFQEVEGTTDATGTTVLTGVARPLAGGPAVLLDIQAIHGFPSTPFGNGCWESAEVDAFAPEVPAAQSLDVTPDKYGAGSALVCQSLILHGKVVDGDGASVAGLRLTFQESGTPDPMPAYDVTTGADGTFSAQILISGPEPPELAPDSTLVFGTAAAQQLSYAAGACQRTANVSLDATVAKPVDWFRGQVVVLTAEADVVGETCGVSGGPATTLPPTNRAEQETAASGDRHGLAISLGLAIGLAVVGLWFVPRPRARRR